MEYVLPFGAALCSPPFGIRHLRQKGKYCPLLVDFVKWIFVEF